MEMTMNNGFCEMTECELIKLDGGSFWDDLACGFGEAFGLENVTASEIVQASGRMLGDFYNSIYRFF